MPPTPADPDAKHNARAWLIPALTSVATLTVYLLTLSPEVGAGDAAELSLQSWQVGVSHPPGYPVYLFLGKLFTLVTSEPSQATNLLSAVATAVAVGLLCAITLSLTADVTSSILAALLFGLVPTIWAGAVTTEVYNVNVCLVAITLLILVRARDTKGVGGLMAGGTVFGLSLGAGLANLLLLPGLVWLLWHVCGARTRRILWFLVIVGSLAVVECAWTLWRSQALPPLGTKYVPDTLENLAQYLRGRQYLPIEWPPLGFYVSRLGEHTLYWLASFLWLGVAIGLVGLWALRRQRRTLCVGLVLMFVANMGYFTFHTWQDYREMVAPSYLVFGVWLALGIHALIRLGRRFDAPALPGVIVTALVGGLLLSGLRAARQEDHATPLSDFVGASFEVMPPDALVVTEWATFTPMLYFQRVHGLRPDVTLIERAEGPRRYRWGDVDDWRQYALEAALVRPVVLDVKDEALSRWTHIEPFLAPRWYRIR
jgi:MFS family permease